MKKDWSDEQVLITGGLGFIGSSLANRLVQLDAKVTILDAQIEGYGANFKNICEVQDDIDIIDKDVRNITHLRSEVEKADIIYHCAAQLSRTVSMEEPVLDTEINCIGLLNILQSASLLNNPPRVIFTSSQAVVGSPYTNPIRSNTEADPLDIYGANKRAGELYCKIYSRSRGVPTVVARLTNVYGPRAQLNNPNYGVINQFIRASLLGEELTVFKPGDMLRDFVYISDVVEGLLKLGNLKEPNGDRFMICSGTGTSIKELAEKIVDTFGRGEVKLVPWPDDWESIKVGNIVGDPSKLISKTDWKPEVNLSEGLQRTSKFYTEHRDSYIN